MKTLITLFTLALLAVSCSRFRVKPKPYSTWKIDGVEYKNNDYLGTKDNAYGSRSLLLINNSHYNNRYAPFQPGVTFSFNYPYFPTSGSYTIYNKYRSGDVGISFSRDSNVYIISKYDTHRLVAEIKNRMPHYVLPPSIFKKYVISYVVNSGIPIYNWVETDDSIIIEGEFYAPPMDE